MFLFVIVVIFIELDSHMDTSSVRKEIFVSLTVTSGGTKATITISDGSHRIFSRWCPFRCMTTNNHDTSIYKFHRFFFFDWVMKAQSPVIMDESFPVRLDEDSEEEFYYNFVNESSPVLGEYSSLFTSQ
jgi:hypothetical protein